MGNKRKIACSGVYSTRVSRVLMLWSGIEVSPDCAIVDRYSTPRSGQFAVSQLTRAAFWSNSRCPTSAINVRSSPHGSSAHVSTRAMSAHGSWQV